MSGGSGTRLWPLSRESYPKQFLPLVGDKSMLQSTWLRAAPVAAHAPILVANEEHRFMAAEQLQQLGVKPSAILLEPKGRNTAPAIAVAALEATRDGADPLLLVMPSDHVIQNEAAFQAAVTAAAAAAEQGKLVTFGIKPTAPETGYGYIKAGTGNGVSAVERFVEKPDLATAQSYLASGEYYWNSGMFLFRASRYLEELRKFHPAIVDACQKAWENGKRDADFTRLDKDAFAASPSDSIDYAVMEKDRRRGCGAIGRRLERRWFVVLATGCFQAGCARQRASWRCDPARLQEHLCLRFAPDRHGGAGGCGGRRDAGCRAGRSPRPHPGGQDVVSQIKTAGRSEATWHRKVYRPWGAYDSIDMGQRHQVKRITVKPGAVLSLQMHHHRAEHWIVVSGTAEVTRGEEVLLLTENQSTYIPLGVTHRLRNPGKLPLELIEVQSGSYLGEDDIVRFEDTYGRA